MKSAYKLVRRNKQGKLVSAFAGEIMKDLEVTYLPNEWVESHVEHPHYGLFVGSTPEKAFISVISLEQITFDGKYQVWECEVEEFDFKPRPLMDYNTFYSFEEADFDVNFYIVKRVKLLRQMTLAEITASISD